MATYPPTGSAAPNTPMGAGNPPYIPTVDSKLEEKVQQKAKNNLYQKSTIIDNVRFKESPDEAKLKELLREELRFEMAKHLSENLSFTKTEDLANDTTTVFTRCYVFTREQLVELCREIVEDR